MIVIKQKMIFYQDDVTLVFVGVTQREVEDRLGVDVLNDGVRDADQTTLMVLLEDAAEQRFLKCSR